MEVEKETEKKPAHRPEKKVEKVQPSKLQRHKPFSHVTRMNEPPLAYQEGHFYHMPTGDLLDPQPTHEAIFGPQPKKKT